MSTSSATSSSAHVDHLPPRFYNAGITAFARITATRPDSAHWIAANQIIYGCAAPVTRAGAWKAAITATGTALPGTRHATQEGQPSSAQLLFPTSPAATPSAQGTALINALWAPEGLPMKIISVPADHDFASPQEALEALEMAPSIPWHQAAVAARPWSPLEPALPLDPGRIPASVLPDASKTKLVQAWAACERAGHMSEEVQLNWRLTSLQISSAQTVSRTIARPPYQEHESDYPTLSSKMHDFTEAMNGLKEQEANRLRPLLTLLDDADFHSQLRAAAGRSIGLRAWVLDFCTALTDPLTESEMGQQYLMGTMFPGLAGPGAPRQAVQDYYTRIGQGHDMLAWNPDAWVQTWRRATHPDASDWSSLPEWNEQVSKGLELTSAYLTAQARAQSMLAACFGRTRDLIREEIDHVVGEIFSPVALSRGHTTRVVDADGTEITTTEPLLGAEHHELEEELEHLEANYATFSYDPHADSSHDTLAQADARSTDQLEASAQRQERFAGRAEVVLAGLQVLSIVLSLRSLLGGDDPPPGQDVWHSRNWQDVSEWCGVVGTVVQPALHQCAVRLAASGSTTSALGAVSTSRVAVTAARIETCFGVGVACIALASNIWTFAQDWHNGASSEQLTHDGLDVIASGLGVAALVTPPPADLCFGVAAFTVGIVNWAEDWFVNDYIPASIWGAEAVQQGHMRYQAAHATPFYQQGAGRRMLITGIRRRRRGRRYFVDLSAPYPYGFGTLDPDATGILNTMTNGKKLVCIIRGETACSLVAFGGVQGPRIEPNHHDEYSQEAAERRTIEGAAASQSSCIFQAAAFDSGVASVLLPSQLFPCTTWSGSMLGIDGAETMLRRFENELAAQQRSQHHPVSLRVVVEVFEIPTSAASPVSLVANYRYGNPSDDIRLVGRSEPMALVPTNHQTGMNMWGHYALYDPSEVPGAADHADHEGSTGE